MKHFIYWNQTTKKSEEEIKSIMDKQANGEEYKLAIVDTDRITIYKYWNNYG